LVIWLSSIYIFYQFILTNKPKYLFLSSLLYGLTLFWYELALFLPIIHLLFYGKFVILKEYKIDLLKSIKIFSSFGIYFFIFVLFRLTASFGLSSQFDRTQVLPIDNIFIRIMSILKVTFWEYPKMENFIGSQAFKNSPFMGISIIIISLIFVFLLITWFLPIFKLSNEPDLFSKNDYIFTFIVSLSLCLYPVIPFFLSPAWFDTRHTYLSHLGLAILIVLIIRLVLESVQKLPHKGIQYTSIIILLYFLSQVLTQNAETMIGLGTIWRQVGLDLKNYEIIVKEEFPHVQPHTLFLIKDAETLRQYVPVFAGNWVVNGFFRKIYPLQGVQGDYYNLPSEDHTAKLMFKINSDLKSINVAAHKYNFEQIIILDGKNQLRPFSAIKIKTPQGDYVKRLQNSPNSDNVSSVLEISIP
jgi:hypothetical protein